MVYNRQLVNYSPFTPALGTMLYNAFKPRTSSRQGYSNTRTVTRTRTKGKQMKSQIKRIITADKPAKHLTFYAPASILHNSIYTICPTQGVTQGDTNAQRDGDQIQTCALKLKGQFFTDAAAAGYTYRILVGYSGEEYATGVAWNITGLTEAELFLPLTGNGHRTNAIVNPKAFTVLHDQLIDVNSLLEGVPDVASFDMNINLSNQKFYYQSTASVYGKTRNLYVVLIAVRSGGTLGVTDAGDIQLSGDLIFK